MFVEKWQIKGRLAGWVAAEAVKIAEVRVQQILELAVDRWRTSGFDSFDGSENSLTVRLYAHCIEARRASPDFAMFQVSWEAPQPSAEILAGSAPPATSARPDLRFSVGDRQLVVEAKRLDGSTTLYREYVVEGMRRFWEGRYLSDPGMLLGYLSGPSHAEAVVGINTAITRVHPPTQTDDRCLSGLVMIRADLGKSTSAYAGQRSLWHFAVSV